MVSGEERGERRGRGASGEGQGARDEGRGARGGRGRGSEDLVDWIGKNESSGRKLYLLVKGTSNALRQNSFSQLRRSQVATHVT
jgi:hypothetical protein